jgi:hypothetical protein
MLDADPADGSCGWVRHGAGCDVAEAWLLLPAGEVAVTMPDGTARALAVAMPPDLGLALRDLPRQTLLTLTVALDSPEASACRIHDARSGKPLLPDDRAITACRLQFAVEEVAFRQ